MTQFSAIMKDKLRLICLIAIVGTPLIAGLALNAQAAEVVSQELKKGRTEPEFLQVPSDDAAMHRAIIEAQSTIGKFIAALKSPEPGQRDFEIKKTFIQGSQLERVWLSDVRFINGHFQGRVDEKPRKIRELKLGQLVSVNPNQISDWLYVDNGALVGGKGILVGGYTFRAHYNELSHPDCTDQQPLPCGVGYHHPILKSSVLSDFYAAAHIWRSGHIDHSCGADDFARPSLMYARVISCGPPYHNMRESSDREQTPVFTVLDRPGCAAHGSHRPESTSR